MRPEPESDTINNNNGLIDPFHFVPRGQKIDPITFDSKLKDANHRQYLLLLITSHPESTDTPNTFEIIQGRDEVYKFIRDNIEDIDVVDSRIMVTHQSLEESITLLQFVRHIKDEHLVEDDDFDIMDYVIDADSEMIQASGIIPETEEKSTNDMSSDELMEYCQKMIDKNR